MEIETPQPHHTACPNFLPAKLMPRAAFEMRGCILLLIVSFAVFTMKRRSRQKTGFIPFMYYLSYNHTLLLLTIAPLKCAGLLAP
jgi:hypothetical protein